MPARRAATQPRLIPTERAESPLEALLALHLTASGIPFEREVRFAPPRRWRVDFRIAGWLMVECEGKVWGGRHTRGAGFMADIEKYNTVTLLGYALLRFTREQIENGTALALIERVLAARTEARHHGHDPIPPTPARGGARRVSQPRLQGARQVARRSGQRVRDLPQRDS